MQEEKGQRKKVVTDEPLNWPAKIVDGALVVEPICEEIDRGNGRVDVLVKVPSLALINKFKEANNIQ